MREFTVHAWTCLESDRHYAVGASRSVRVDGKVKPADQEMVA